MSKRTILLILSPFIVCILVIAFTIGVVFMSISAKANSINDSNSEIFRETLLGDAIYLYNLTEGKYGTIEELCSILYLKNNLHNISNEKSIKESYSKDKVESIVKELNDGKKIDDLVDFKEKIIYNNLKTVFSIMYNNMYTIENKKAVYNSFFPIPEKVIWNKNEKNEFVKAYKSTYSLDWEDGRESPTGQSSHLGIDIIDEAGTPIVACEDGVIEKIGFNEIGGNRVGIKSNNGKKYYYYAHINNFVTGLKEGSIVKAGDVIGFMGSTGFPKGMINHLHFGIRLENLTVEEKAIFENFRYKFGLSPFISTDEDTSGYWINPYFIVLKNIENRKTIIQSENGIFTNIYKSSINSSFTNSSDFIKSIEMLAKEEELSSRVPWQITVAQAILETGYGKHIPSDMYSGKLSYNLFGIKAVENENFVECYSPEQEGDIWVNRISKFKSYVSYMDSIKDHSIFLRKNSRYANCFNYSDPYSWADELQKAGYATDKEYASKLKAIISEAIKN